MARFYRTASGTPRDYMYRLNTPLMQSVIEKNDQYITENLGQLGSLNEAAVSFAFLQPDENRAKQIMDDYSNSISSIAETIRKNPANWRNEEGSIREIGKKLVADYKTGEIGKLKGNYDKYKAAADYIDKRVEQFAKEGKGLTPEEGEAYKRHFLSQFVQRDPKGTNYDPSTGKYNIIDTFTPMDNINLQKRLGEELDKLKADKSKYRFNSTTGKGEYFNEEMNRFEAVTPERVLDILTSRLNDPQVMRYLQERSTVGLMPGVFDEQGRFIPPYSHEKVPITEKEKGDVKNLEYLISIEKNPKNKKLLQDNLKKFNEDIANRRALKWGDTPLASTLYGLVKQHSYLDEEHENLLKPDSAAINRYTQGQLNSRLGRQLDNAYKIAKLREDGTAKRAADRLAFDYWNNEEGDPAKAGAGAKGTTKAPEKAPLNTTVSKLATNSFEGITITDNNNNEVPLYSVKGIATAKDSYSTILKDNQEKLKQLNKILEKQPDPTDFEANRIYNEARAEKNRLDFQNSKLSSDLKELSKWDEISEDAALRGHPKAGTPLDQTDVKLYKEFKAKGDKNIELELKELKRRFPDIVENVNAGTALGGGKGLTITRTREHPKVVEYKDRLEKYRRVQERVNENKEEFLSTSRRDVVDSDALQLNEQDSKDISELILANNQELVMYDQDGKKSGSKSAQFQDLEGKGISWFAPKADNFRGNFGTKGLVDYLNRNGVKMQVVSVSPTTRIGNGAGVARVRFSGEDNDIPKGDYYIALTPEVAAAIGKKYSTSTDPEVKGLATEMGDSEAIGIKNQMLKMTANKTLGEEGKDPVEFEIFVTDHVGNKIPLNVTRYVLADGRVQLGVSYFDTKTNSEQPFPKVGGKDNLPGMFNGVNEFIHYWKAFKYPKATN